MFFPFYIRLSSLKQSHYTAGLFVRTLQRFLSALLSFYMWLISLPVAVGVSWQADLTEASARNCLNNISC